MRRILRTGMLASGLALAVAGCEVSCGASPTSSRGPSAPGGSQSAAAGGAAPAADIPERPAAGTIQGRPFAVEDAVLERGILELRQGEEFLADLAVLIFLFLDDGEAVPEGRSWDVDCRDGWSADAPHIHARWRVGEDRTPKGKAVTCGYRLRLDFGEATAGGALPGRIRMAVPELDTEIAGTFEARVEGAETAGGEPDLGRDDTEALREVARRWLAEREGGPVEITHDALAHLQASAPEGGVQTGFGIYWWRPAESSREAVPQKLQFAKRDGAWQVDGPLEAWQLRAAHPLRRADGLSPALVRLAARHVEEEHRRRHGDAPLAATVEGQAYNPKTGFAEVELRVWRGAEAKEATLLRRAEPGGESVRILLRTGAGYPAYNDPASWRVERRLAADEEIDFAAGRVERG